MNLAQQNIVLVGCAGHAKVIIDIIERAGKYKVVALFDMKHNIGKSLYGYEVVDSEVNLSQYIESLNISGGIVAIGDAVARKKVVDRIQGQLPNFEFINAIHPSACIGRGVSIGAGNVIVAGATINCDASIANHCIINTNASLGHEAVMRDFSSLSPNATIGGGADIGEMTVIAMSATVLHNKVVGDHTIVGAGSVVTKDIESSVVAYGTPCKVIRERNHNEKYL